MRNAYTKRSDSQIDRDQAVKDLRLTVRKIASAGTFSDVMKHAEELQHQAFDLKDWAKGYRKARWGTYQDEHRQQFAEASNER